MVVDEGRDGAVGGHAGDEAAVVAGDEVAGVIVGGAVGLVGGVAQGGGAAGGRPAMLLACGDVAEGEVAAGVVPDGAFGEAMAGRDLVDLHVFVHEVEQALVDDSEHGSAF